MIHIYKKHVRAQALIIGRYDDYYFYDYYYDYYCDYCYYDYYYVYYNYFLRFVSTGSW